MPRLKYLDGLRGVAVFSVLIYHFSQLYSWGNFPFSLGSYGVQVFFIISGYVIFFSARSKNSILAFIKNRIIRIYPTYFICLTISIILLLYSGTSERSLLELFSNYLFFHKLLGFKHVDGVYWTLLIEVVFYGYVVLASMFLKLKARSVYLSILIHTLLIALINFSEWNMPSLLRIVTLFDFGIYFSLGVVYYLKQNNEVSNWDVSIVVFLALLGITFNDSTKMHYSQFDLGVVPFQVMSAILIVLSYVFFFNKQVQRLLSSRFLLFLGYISYPLYLLHNVGGKAFLEIMNITIDNIVIPFIVYLLFSITLAYFISKYIDYGFCTNLKKHIKT